MHFKWNYEPPTQQERLSAEELGEKLSLSPVLALLLIRRGITTESAAKRFFRPQLADLINPFLMKDMDVAVDRLMLSDAKSASSFMATTTSTDARLWHWSTSS